MVFATLASAVIFAIMTNKSIKESRRAKALEIHTTVLQNFAKSWLDQLPNIPLQYEPVRSPPKPEMYEFEKNPLLVLDMKNHTPSEWEILEKWEKFKRLFHEYDKKRYELFEHVRNMSLERTGLNYEPQLDTNTIAEFFPWSIYEQHVYWAKNKEKKYSLGFFTKEKDGEYMVRLESITASYLFKVNNNEIKEKTCEIYETMMNDFGLFSKEIERILRIAEDLEGYRKELENMLKNFMFIPLLSGTCQFIKWAVP
jgi:hypothetical protein